ncbi:MAG: hypothetical protein IPJ23_03910 [Ignavibacteriales bacterium]|nr:hypothetical protein [Ignavibacteriales bacterium]
MFGTERSSFRGWAGRISMYIRMGGELNIYGYNHIGRGSLIWILEGGKISFEGNTFTAGNSKIISKRVLKLVKIVQLPGV